MILPNALCALCVALDGYTRSCPHCSCAEPAIYSRYLHCVFKSHMHQDIGTPSLAQRQEAGMKALQAGDFSVALENYHAACGAHLAIFLNKHFIQLPAE